MYAMYVCMYGCMYGCMDVWMYGCMDVWMYMHVCMHMSMYLCIDVCVDENQCDGMCCFLLCVMCARMLMLCCCFLFLCACCCVCFSGLTPLSLIRLSYSDPSSHTRIHIETQRDWTEFYQVRDTTRQQQCVCAAQLFSHSLPLRVALVCV